MVTGALDFKSDGHPMLNSVLVLVGKASFVVLLFFASHYSDDSSAGYRFTCLGCLKEDFARFSRGIVTMGQETDTELRIVKCALRCLVIEANKLRDACLWRS